MNDSYSNKQLQEVMESAKRMNVELDEAEAIAWLDAIHKAGEGRDIVIDERAGVFGQNIAMLDFSPERLEYFRTIGGLVEFYDVPGKVETALALSGSSAQSKIQRYPGDCDYFERVNIIAPTKEEACQILADIMREKALDFRQGPTYQLIEVKLGSYPAPFVQGKATLPAGSADLVAAG